ncbi:hypothetical protein GALMADRAFT_88948 [Galerina marginata CBS 339.88]|uniref:BTB domain-containing protein n=1 Tax=Galerina marginata (strain CBS 339.88) TaxID=685588 RepID=A0A067TT67_GALM3|nr:hypothetical protein GALMADRAFT_88948 [Galerina marginata CBS 339.88]
MSSRCHDAKYYFHDGNITILVSDTLFKVHRQFLARDASAFENMFSLNLDRARQATSSGSMPFQQDGNNDENPIRMEGDTPDEFRALLWSLYALPHEIAGATSFHGDPVKLSNVARMSHKYHFASTETWALVALLVVIDLQSRAPVPLSTDVLVKATEAAVLCENTPLLDALRVRWRKLIENLQDLGTAISVTERLGLKDLCGLAYYMAVSHKGRESWISELGLNREQRIRLLSGHHNLSQQCDSLPTDPPDILHHDDCDDPDICDEDWGVLWMAMLAYGQPCFLGMPMESQPQLVNKIDILGRLDRAIGILTALLEGTFPEISIYDFANHEDCWKPALVATQSLHERVQGDLMAFFEDGI